jgi:hypothetical protein
VFYFAKTLQALGMGLLGVGLLVGMQQHDTRGELTMLAIGGVVFFVGWVLERQRRSGESI